MNSVLFDTVASGPLVAAFAVAMLAGLVSFFAPCMLPLVPGFLAYVTGLTGTDLTTSPTAVSDVAMRTSPRLRTLAGSALFVSGFTVVFTLLAYAAGQLGRALLLYALLVEAIAGGLTVLLGLAFIGLLPGADRTWRVTRLPRAGLAVPRLRRRPAPTAGLQRLNTPSQRADHPLWRPAADRRRRRLDHRRLDRLRQLWTDFVNWLRATVGPGSIDI